MKGSDDLGVILSRGLGLVLVEFLEKCIPNGWCVHDGYPTPL